jgi:plastocyanin
MSKNIYYIVFGVLIIAFVVTMFFFSRNLGQEIQPIEPIPVPDMPLYNVNDFNLNLNSYLNSDISQTKAVSIANFRFNPDSITVKIGDTVSWSNDDQAPHQVAGSIFGSQPLNTGDSYSFTFTQAGTYDYHCAIHPTMTGQIIVQ